MKYFWFSKLQRSIAKKDCERNMERFVSCFVKTENGYDEFTEVTNDNKPRGSWDDYILVLKSENPIVCYGDYPN